MQWQTHIVFRFAVNSSSQPKLVTRLLGRLAGWWEHLEDVFVKGSIVAEMGNIIQVCGSLADNSIR